MNPKRTQRLWREEGLRVPARARKRRRAADQPDRSALRASGPHEVWAIDFQHDMTADGRPLRLVNVVDEFTREALTMHAERSISPIRPWASSRRWWPGAEAPRGSCAATTPPSWPATRCATGVGFSHAQTAFIEPGAPWQNPFVESFHARVRDELLNTEQFACLAEAQVVVIADWREDYNTRRPHSALGMLTPTAFAADRTHATAP